MPLRLRRAADQFPRARWEPSNEHLVIMSGDTVIGSLKKQTGGTLGDRWAWSITCVRPIPAKARAMGGPRPATRRNSSSPRPGGRGSRVGKLVVI